jgi:hypothetical protein
VSNLTPSVLTARRRALYYSDANGITEVVVGAALIVFGSRDYFAAKLAPLGTFAREFAFFGTIILYGLLILGNKRIAEWLKERLIYPRTGYVSTPDEDEEIGASPRESLLVVLAFLIGIVLFAFFAFHARWILSLAMLLLFTSYVFVSGQSKLDPLRSSLFLIPLIGGLAWWTFAKPIPSFNSLFTVLGGSLAIAGAIRLSLYLHRNPQPNS